jgi:hypothetical protein
MEDWEFWPRLRHPAATMAAATRRTAAIAFGLVMEERAPLENKEFLFITKFFEVMGHFSGTWDGIGPGSRATPSKLVASPRAGRQHSILEARNPYL